MLVSCEGIVNVMFLHHHKADAIRQRPVFVLPFAHELHTLIQQLRTQRHNERTRTGAQSRHERKKISMVGSTRAGVAQFQKNKFGGYYRMSGVRFGQRAGCTGSSLRNRAK